MAVVPGLVCEKPGKGKDAGCYSGFFLALQAPCMKKEAYEGFGTGIDVIVGVRHVFLEGMVSGFVKTAA
jgi:hypothetical protein